MSGSVREAAHENHRHIVHVSGIGIFTPGSGPLVSCFMSCFEDITKVERDGRMV